MSDKFEKGAENTILQMATLQRFPAHSSMGVASTEAIKPQPHKFNSKMIQKNSETQRN